LSSLVSSSIWLEYRPAQAAFCNLTREVPAEEFVPVVPAGFDIAGSFDGVTTAVGPDGVPRIRYQLRAVEFRSAESRASPCGSC
jgi:hypothetical protein